MAVSLKPLDQQVIVITGAGRTHGHGSKDHTESEAELAGARRSS